MRLKVVSPGPERESYLPWLLLADRSEEQVRGYVQRGLLYVAVENGADIGVVVAVPTQLACVELRALAIDPAHQQQGRGQELLTLVLDDLSWRGYSRVVTGAGNACIEEIAFYQRAGFRIWRVEQDYFSPDKGYPAGLEENGIPLRDMLWFERTN